jgi:enamine deaminase RidA (YjgF/YER057c/UK114 family)
MSSTGSALAVLATGPLGGAIARGTSTSASFAIALAGKDLALALSELDAAGAGPDSTAFAEATAPMVRAALHTLRAVPDQTADLAHLVGGQSVMRDRQGEGADMRATVDNPRTVPEPVGPYAHVARVDVGGGALLITAGQIAVDDAGQVVAPGDVVAQAERIFELIGGILAAHGAGLADVLHIRTFMTDLDDLPGYAQVRRRLFPGTPPPASTTVEVSRLFRAGAVLEVEATAAVPAPSAA